jgi:hypothetical protein
VKNTFGKCVYVIEVQCFHDDFDDSVFDIFLQALLQENALP